MLQPQLTSFLGSVRIIYIYILYIYILHLGESNGKLPLRTCPECSVPEPYLLPDWAVVPAKTGPKRLNTNYDDGITFVQSIRKFSLPS
jgi:hypothetical protein